MTNFDMIVGNLFGSRVEIREKTEDEKKSDAWEEYCEQHPYVMMQCRGCEKLTREIRLSHGFCEKCRGFQVIQGGLDAQTP